MIKFLLSGSDVGFAVSEIYMPVPNEMPPETRASGQLLAYMRMVDLLILIGNIPFQSLKYSFSSFNGFFLCRVTERLNSQSEGC